MKKYIIIIALLINVNLGSGKDKNGVKYDTEIKVENDSLLVVEDWMINDSVWLYWDFLNPETEDSLKIEDWMYDEKLFTK